MGRPAMPQLTVAQGQERGVSIRSGEKTEESQSVSVCERSQVSTSGRDGNLVGRD